MTTVGKLEDVSIKKIEWRIDDFVKLPNDGNAFKSPLFPFLKEFWCLIINPNGQTENNSVGHIGLYLQRNVSGLPIHLAFSLSFKTFDGKKHGEKSCTYVYEKSEGFGWPTFMSRSTLIRKKAQLMPSDTLTVVCTIEHESKPPDATVTDKLINDLSEIFKCGEHSDVIIRVKGVEFRLHRNILAGRSSYFRSMFQAEMIENTTGIVTIDDCEPDVFRIFALFIYTGKLDEMTVENVCDLYVVADKYHEEQLKEKCLCCMKNIISVESFCDLFVIAMQYEDKELLQCASYFFCRHMKEITLSEKWLTFMGTYPKQANSLYITACYNESDRGSPSPGKKLKRM